MPLLLKIKVLPEMVGNFMLSVVLIVSFFVMLISFCAYMMNTTLEEVLENETGSSVVTHDYTYESAESSSAA